MESVEAEEDKAVERGALTTKKKTKPKGWPATEVEMRAVDSLVPYARNARTHSPKQVDQIAASIQEWGWTVPCLIDEKGGMIAGHGRLLAAKKLGIADVPVMVALGWSEAQKRAYVLADNKLAENAGWDTDLLKLEFGELSALDFDLGLTGFDVNEVSGFTNNNQLGDPDDVPEAQEVAVSQAGDLWVMGGHRLLCGDSTSADDFSRLGSDSFDLCMTDPPYGVGWDYDTHDDTKDGLAKTIAGFFSIARASCEVVALTPGVANLFSYPEPPTWVLCWFTGSGVGLCRWGFVSWHPIAVWGKDPKLSAGEGSHPDGFKWMITQDDATESSALDHSCPKPFSVWDRFMQRLSSKKTTSVYEPFCGSGTTLIAAEKNGLSCGAIEISPRYVDVSIRRWQDFTGRQATLEGTDLTFAQVAEQRLAEGVA